MKKGKIYGIGLGPGDPELITLKSANLIKSSEHILFFKKKNSESRAFNIVKNIIRDDAFKIGLEFPVTTEIDSSNKAYKDIMQSFYEQCVIKIDNILKKSFDICLLCEGDPFFYGSFIHIFQRLKKSYDIEIIPGVTGISGAWSSSKFPIVSGNEIMTILMGTLEEEKLKLQIKKSDVLVIMKIGKNFKKIFKVLKELNLLGKACLITNATTKNEKIYKLDSINIETAPYFSIILLKTK